MDNLIAKIHALLDRQRAYPDAVPLLPKDSYRPVPFSGDNFHFFARNSGDADSHNQTIAFIDGGKAELLSTPNLSVGFVRAVACAYKGMKKAFSLSTEFYACVSSSALDSDIGHKTELFPAKGSVLPRTELLSFSSTDDSIRNGVRRASPSVLLNVVRRFAELELAMATIDKLAKGDMVVLDGSLQQSYTNEGRLLGLLREKSGEHEINATGVSKTNSLLTFSGVPFGSILASHHQRRQWWYSPVATPIGDAPCISFARLHERSPHVFLIESCREQTDSLFTGLASYSMDPVFPGYPYGLVEADRAARVSNQDASYLQTKLTEKIGRKDGHSLLAAKNAHDILDSIRF